MPSSRRWARACSAAGGGWRQLRISRLGGTLGETLGNLLQQGLGQSRNIPSQTQPTPAAPPAPQSVPPPPPSQDSQPMNDVLRQLFNR